MFCKTGVHSWIHRPDWIFFSISCNTYTHLMLFQTTSTETSTRFKPFELKTGMSLAPVIRKHLSLETKRLLDEGIRLQVSSSYLNSSINQLYLQQIWVESVWDDIVTFGWLHCKAESRALQDRNGIVLSWKSTKSLIIKQIYKSAGNIIVSGSPPFSLVSRMTVLVCLRSERQRFSWAN